jgi:hypothetical protein
VRQTKKEVDPRLAMALVGALLVIGGVFAWKQFAPSGAGPVSAKAAGLGKPVYPAGSMGGNAALPQDSK